MLVQKLEINQSEKRMKGIISEDCIKVGDNLLFVARDINIVYSLNINTGKINLLGSLPEEDIFQNRVSSKIVLWEDKIIFIPLNAKKIWIYNRNTSECHGIGIKKKDDKYMKFKMFQAILYETKLFMIGSHYPAIVCMDLENESLTYFEEVFDELKEKKEELNDCFVRCDYVQQQQYFYMASCLSNQVLKFDMSTCEYTWITVGSDKNRYSGITWDGENFWLAPRRNTSIVKWDGKDGIYEYTLPKEFMKDDWQLLGAVFENNRINFPGMRSQKMISISKFDNADIIVSDGQYSFYKRLNDKYIVKQTIDGRIILQDKEGNEKEYNNVVDRKTLIDFWCREPMFEYLIRENCRENQLINLDVLCEELKNKEVISENMQDRECGKRIWQYLKG